MTGGRTRLDEAKKQAKDLVSTLGRDGAAMVISFDDTAQTLAPFTSDQRVLKNVIDSIEPTDRRSKAVASRENHWHGAGRGCEDVMVGSVQGDRLVW